MVDASSTGRSRPLRVLLWFWGRRPSGTSIAHRFAEGLVRHPGIELHLSLSRQSESFSQTSRLALTQGAHVDTYQSAGELLLAPFRIPAARRCLRSYAKAKKIDVVFSPMPHLWNGFVHGGRRSDFPPYLVTIHDAIPHCGEDTRFLRWLLRSEVRAATTVLVPSRFVADQVRQAHEVPASQIRVLPLGVQAPATEYALQPRTLAPERPPALLFFGRLLPYKGLDLLVEAFALMRSARPDLTLRIAGPGRKTDLPTEWFGTPGLTIDCRWIPEPELPDLFARHDLLVLPYREATQSGAVVTAYTYGMPVVVTPVGGLPEQVIGGLTGEVAAAVEPVAICEAVLALVQSPEHYRACSKGVLAHVNARLTWRALTEELIEILHLTAHQAVPADGEVA